MRTSFCSESISSCFVKAIASESSKSGEGRDRARLSAEGQRGRLAQRPRRAAVTTPSPPVVYNRRRAAPRPPRRPDSIPQQRGRRTSMTQQTHDQYGPDDQANDLSRRDFVAMGLAAGVVAAGVPAAAALPVVETMVEIKTADGTCDA